VRKIVTIDHGGVFCAAATMLAMKSNRLLAAAAMAAALLLSDACGADEDGNGGTKPSSSPTTKLIDYEKGNSNGGVELKKAADVSKLEGAPDDFKRFIAGVTDQATQGVTDNECPIIVGVSKIDTSGYASGSIRECGGAAFIWAKRDGVWQQIWGGQTTPGCNDMRKYSVPKAIAGEKCWDGKDEVDYTG
jgi:hypothetical protein